MYFAYTDGAYRGSKGIGGFVAIICNNNMDIISVSIRVKQGGTSNVYEFKGILLAMKEALQMGINKLTIYTDSEFVANSFNKKYKIKKEHLIPLRDKVFELANKFEHFELQHIPREKNPSDEYLRKIIDSMVK
jgi:ribonuclease HI